AAQTAVILDADMIVTRPIEPLVAEVERSGRMIAVADRLGDRFDERWGAILGLGELRRHPYVNCGLLIVPDGVGERLFPLWRDAPPRRARGRERTIRPAPHPAQAVDAATRFERLLGVAAAIVGRR